MRLLVFLSVLAIFALIADSAPVKSHALRFKTIKKSKTKTHEFEEHDYPLAGLELEFSTPVTLYSSISKAFSLPADKSSLGATKMLVEKRALLDITADLPQSDVLATIEVVTGPVSTEKEPSEVMQLALTTLAQAFSGACYYYFSQDQITWIKKGEKPVTAKAAPVKGVLGGYSGYVPLTKVFDYFTAKLKDLSDSGKLKPDDAAAFKIEPAAQAGFVPYLKCTVVDEFDTVNIGLQVNFGMKVKNLVKGSFTTGSSSVDATIQACRTAYTTYKATAASLSAEDDVSLAASFVLFCWVTATETRNFWLHNSGAATKNMYQTMPKCSARDISRSATLAGRKALATWQATWATHDDVKTAIATAFATSLCTTISSDCGFTGISNPTTAGKAKFIELFVANLPLAYGFAAGAYGIDGEVDPTDPLKTAKTLETGAAYGYGPSVNDGQTNVGVVPYISYKMFDIDDEPACVFENRSPDSSVKPDVAEAKTFEELKYLQTIIGWNA